MRQPAARRSPAVFVAWIIASFWASYAAQAADAPSPDEAYLNALQGPWTMDGVLRGDPVSYVASGERFLDGGWLKLHMIDAQTPPQYEAEVFLGYDSKAGDYVVHWLDRFGAAGARVVGTGRREGERLSVIFPYAEGAFRDTFVRVPENNSWTLLIESQETSGAWSTFASYTLVRPRASR
jgi:hypothetical protein